MRLSPISRPTVNFFTSSILLFGGSFGGIHLTNMVAPYSEWSRLVGFLMLPTAFLVSMQLWPWLNGLVANCLGRFSRKQTIPKTLPVIYQRIAGLFAFVLTSIAISLIAGLILTPPKMQIVVDPGFKILVPVAVIYGTLCWACMQRGYVQRLDV